jgi:hypothetical protein
MGLEVFLTAKKIEGILVPDYPEMFFTAVLEHAKQNAKRFPLLSTVDPHATTTFEEPSRPGLLAEWEETKPLIQTPDDEKKWAMVQQWLKDGEQFSLLEFVGD